ncbi:fungal-specific transcription factor domain-containing protein [Fennellomyces sp. T-0311]|nr:fungal-specific transcription factor domain-containing protein [Fennellomyces sp. T-0311]
MSYAATPHQHSKVWNSAPVRPLLIRPQSNDAFNSKSVDIPRKKRRRGRRSCNSCRQRRMKCNADTVQPCYGCKKYGVECHFRDDNKPVDPITTFEDRIARLEGLLNRKLHPRRSDDTRALVKKSHLSGLSEEGNIYAYQSLLCGCNGLVSANATLEIIEHMSLLQLNDYGTTRYIGSSSGLHLLSPFEANRSYRIKDERPFILQKVNNDGDELVVVKAGGVEKPATHPRITQSVTVLQDIPGLTEELVDLAIHGYFTFIQPNIPILNKLSFLQQYYYQNPHPPDEYMLSAMCAIGMDFLNFQDGLVVGTDISRDTVWSIKRSLGDKAAKILQVAHRRSQISTLQTLIMLTIFLNISSGDEDEEDSVQWITSGIAINMAQELGLHRSSSKWNLPKGEIELRRRIWYAVYTIDAWIAAELGRPIAIYDDAFDVDIPSVYEIDSPYHTISDNESTAMSYPLLIAQTETCVRENSPVYGFFIQVTLLSHTLRKILGSLYSPVAHDTTKSTVETIEELDAELCTWRSNLPSYLQFDVLFIFYNCIKLLLHRCILESDGAIGTVSWVRSHRVCTTAALNIIDTIEGLMLTISDYIPRSIVGYSVFQAAAIFVYNASSKSEYERQLGRHNLGRCAAAYTKNETSFRNARIVNHFAKILAGSHATEDTTYLFNSGTGDEISTNATNLRRTEIPHHTLRSTSPEALFYSSLPHRLVLNSDISHTKETQPIHHHLSIPTTSLSKQTSDLDSNRPSDFALESTNEARWSTADTCTRSKQPSLSRQHHPSIADHHQSSHSLNEFSDQLNDGMEVRVTELNYSGGILSNEILEYQAERTQSQEMCTPIDFALALWGLYDTF